MHEATIIEALLRQLDSLCLQRGWSRIRSVTVRLGLLSGVVPEALDFAFRALSPGTPAEGSELVLETEPGRFECDGCGEIELEHLSFTCPLCRRPLRLLQAGRDLLLCGVDPLPT